MSIIVLINAFWPACENHRTYLLFLYRISRMLLLYVTSICQPDEKACQNSCMMPLYAVLLHDDDIHAMDEVVIALMEATGISEAEATSIMLCAHMDGIAVVIIEPIERAEYHSMRLKSYGLIISIERA